MRPISPAFLVFVLWGAVGVASSAGRAVAQAPIGVPDTTPVHFAPGDARGEARAAQARYETRRARHFSRTWGGGSGPCDETVGRFCSWYGEGDWVPEPETPEIDALRTRLLTELDSLQDWLPGDGWLLGQRVWYRAERGDWEDALGVASACGPPQEVWWCEALRGFALHGYGRYPEAERAFDRALYGMDLDRAWSWRVPLRAVDGDARRVLEALREAPADSVAGVLDRLWSLADPLHLVEGNDRKTAHFARWTVATLRDGGRTAYGISWGRDLEELLVRHGWEMGWERAPDVRVTGPDRIIGRKHPEGRDFLPPGVVLNVPARSVPEDYVAGRARPRSLHTSPYAPVVLPMEPQVALFPRGRSFLVVSGYELPEDTTRRARQGIPRPWMDPGDQAALADRAGLFLLEGARGAVVAHARSEGARGALVVSGSAGAHFLSTEVWSPERRLAGRYRAAVDHVPVPDDLPVLSDLLLVTRAGPAPTRLEDAVGRVLPTARLPAGNGVGIVWEVTGLGFRAETLTFDLSVERTDRNLLQRLGGFLGVSEPARPLSLRWQEPGPDGPGVLFRHLDLDLPDLEPGRYRIRLLLETPGRDPVATERDFEVLDGAGPR